MVLFALLMTAFFGCMTALSAQRRIAAAGPHEPPFDPPFYRGLYCVIAVHIPVVGYFYYAYTDWALGYLIDPLRLPIAFGLVLASFVFCGYFFFYLGTHAILRAHRPLTALLATGQVGLAVLTFGILFQTELSKLGTYFQYHTGMARGLGLNNGLFQIVVGLAFFTLSGLAVIVWNYRDDRRFPPLEMEDSKW